MTTKEIKVKMLEYNIKHWQLAKAIGVSDMTLTRWFRNDVLDDATQEIILKAINDLKESR